MGDKNLIIPPKVLDVEDSDFIVEVTSSVLNSIQRKRTRAVSKAKEQKIDIEKEINVYGLQAFYFLRNKWSAFIMKAIVALILFEIVLTVGIGLKWFDYEKNRVFLNLIMGENFAQIIGLAYIVVKFLFAPLPKK